MTGRIPILRLRNLLVASLQMGLAQQEAIDVQSRLLQMLDAADRPDARGIVIDITALDVIDAFQARAIDDLASMARVLGAEVVITGIRPPVALTLIDMDLELEGAETAVDLDQGIEKIRTLIEEGGSDHEGIRR